MKNMDSPGYFISWGSERFVPLQRFEDLRPPRHDLIRYYGEVLGTAQTFTQHFSKEPLKSYDIERSLSKNMGRDPSCWNKDANSTSICWLDIVRHGKFEQQSDGSYHCSIQGKLLELDPQSHDRVEFCRSHAVQITNSGPSYEEVKREVEITSGILTDISSELCDFRRYEGSLENLKRAMKIRLSELQSLLIRMAMFPTSTRPPAQYLTPREPEIAVRSESLHAPSPAQSSRSSGSETTSDDDCKRSMGSSPGDSSEDDESGDKNTEDSSEEEGPDAENLDGMVQEGKRTGDGSSKHGSSHQRNNNPDIGGSAARDGDIGGTLSMPLAGEDKNTLSTYRIPLPGATGEPSSLSPTPLENLSLGSLPPPPKSESDSKMNRVPSQKYGAPGMHKSPPKRIRKGCNTGVENDGEPSDVQAHKRRKSTNAPGSHNSRNSNCQERLDAVAWMNAHAHEGWKSEADRARAYARKFGISRSTTTLKTWLGDPKNSQESRIVELKVPSPRLREILSNDNTS